MKLTRHNKAYAVPLLKKRLFGDEVYLIKSFMFHSKDLIYDLEEADSSVNLFQKIIYAISYIMGMFILFFPILISNNIRKIYILNYIKRNGINNYLKKIVISKER